MEGARIVSVETRRPDLRFPFPPDFAKRLSGNKIICARQAREISDRRDRRRPAPHLPPRHVGIVPHRSRQAPPRRRASSITSAPRRPRTTMWSSTSRRRAERNRRSSSTIPRRFGFMLFADANNEHPMLADLGVEPTGNTLDGRLLADLLRGRKTPLKAALLDQTLIAGLGNIYVSEALWRAGLSPRRAAGTIAPANGRAGERAERLATAIRSVIADAIAGRRLVAARLCPRRRLARVFPAFLLGLRPRGRALPQSPAAMARSPASSRAGARHSIAQSANTNCQRQRIIVSNRE